MKILKLFVFCIVYLLISSCNRSVSEGNSGKYDIDKVLNKSEPITINIWHCPSFGADGRLFNRLSCGSSFFNYFF